MSALRIPAAAFGAHLGRRARHAHALRVGARHALDRVDLAQRLAVELGRLERLGEHEDREELGVEPALGDLG